MTQIFSNDLDTLVTKTMIFAQNLSKVFTNTLKEKDNNNNKRAEVGNDQQSLG